MNVQQFFIGDDVIDQPSSVEKEESDVQDTTIQTILKCDDDISKFLYDMKTATENSDKESENESPDVVDQPNSVEKEASDVQDTTFQSNMKCDEFSDEAPADYRGEQGLALVRAHLVGICCASCLASAKGTGGRKLRQRARQLEFVDLAKSDSAEGIVYKLQYRDRGRMQVAAFPLEDYMPEEWLACADMSTPQASKK